MQILSADTQSQLTEEDIQYFFIRLFFNTSKGLMHAAMQRAYRDFNRTIQNIPSEKQVRDQWRHKLYKLLQGQLNIPLSKKFQSQEDFDNWHSESTFLMIAMSD